MRKVLLATLLLFFVAPLGTTQASGDLQARIVSGEPASGWRAQALVRPGGQYLCGGTLVASRWVLTAAHCMRDIQGGTTVALGTKSFDTPGKPIERFFVHGGWSEATYQNDLALLRLREGSWLPPAQLARPEDRPYFSGGQTGFIAGWGTTCFEKCQPASFLRQAEVPIRSDAECSEIYRSYWYPGMICAGEGQADACQGDSGGPLEVEGANGRRILVGVVSWGVECGLPEYPGVYADVSRYLPWIGSYIVSRVDAPGRISFKGSASFRVRASDPLRLPTWFRVSSSRANAFRVTTSGCQSIPAEGSCTVRIRARSKRYVSGTLELVNRAGVVLDRVRVSGLR